MANGQQAQGRRNKTESDTDFLNSFMLGGVGATNMNGQIIENIEIPLNTEIAVPHSLGVVPKFRLVLRHLGGLQLVDGDSPWTEKTIFLKAISPVGTISSNANITGLSASYAPTSVQLAVLNIVGGSSEPTCKKIGATIPSHVVEGGRAYFDYNCLPTISVSGNVSIDVTQETDSKITVSILLLRG